MRDIFFLHYDIKIILSGEIILSGAVEEKKNESGAGTNETLRQLAVSRVFDSKKKIQKLCCDGPQ